MGSSTVKNNELGTRTHQTTYLRLLGHLLGFGISHRFADLPSLNLEVFGNTLSDRWGLSKRNTVPSIWKDNKWLTPRYNKQKQCRRSAGTKYAIGYKNRDMSYSKIKRNVKDLLMESLEFF